MFAARSGSRLCRGRALSAKNKKSSWDVSSLSRVTFALFVVVRELPRQLVESQWRHDARVLGSPSLAPKLLREFLFSQVGFWVAAPFVSHGRFLGCRPFVRSTIARWQEATDPQSPKGGSQRACTHEGCPPHGFWASQNGGVVSAVIPCPHERWRS